MAERGEYFWDRKNCNYLRLLEKISQRMWALLIRTTKTLEHSMKTGAEDESASVGPCFIGSPFKEYVLR